jgi:hypothetical protein
MPGEAQRYLNIAPENGRPAGVVKLSSSLDQKGLSDLHGISGTVTLLASTSANTPHFVVNNH